MKTILISNLIEELEYLAGNGNIKVEIEGTLMCKSKGNLIIATTEKQF